MPALSFQAPALRAVAESLHLPMVAQIARMPAVAAVYRITVMVHDGRASSSAATIIQRREGSVLELAYARALSGKPITHKIPPARIEAFARVLAELGFDKLPDQPDLPDRNIVDLWLIERAAGAFVRGVIVAPELAREKYVKLVDAVRTHLPEALREIAP